MPCTSETSSTRSTLGDVDRISLGNCFFFYERILFIDWKVLQQVATAKRKKNRTALAIGRQATQ
jgi:hypothetical protein